MAYGLKYNLGCKSHLHLWEIKIFEEGYTGNAVERAMGASPVLVKDSAGAVCGTSLELKLEATTDGEYAHLYTTDANKYLVEEYRDGVLYWKGFLVKEQMSEPYVAPPYDVDVRATDGLGILKSMDYELTGNYTLLQLLSALLYKTGLNLNVEVRSAMYAAGMNTSRSMLEQATINAKAFEGNCYEALEQLLQSLNMFVTQHNGRWLVARWADINITGVIYNGSTFVGTNSETPKLLKADADCEPIGYLTMNVVPAAKSVDITNDFVRTASMIGNYDFDNGGTGWVTEGNVYYSNGYAVVDARTTETISKLMAPVLTFKDTLSVFINFQYCIHGTGRHINSQKEFEVEVNCGSYYLTREGWSTTKGTIVITDTVKAVPASDGMREEMSKFEISADACPLGGMVVITFINKNIRSTGGSGEVFGDVRVAITDVVYTMSTSKGVKTTVSIEENASKKAEDVSVLLMTAEGYANPALLFPGALKVGSNYPSSWYVGGHVDNFFNHIVSSVVSRVRVASKELTGVITGTDLWLNMVVKDGVYNKYFYVESGSYNQYEEEFDVTLREILPFAPIGGVSRSSARAVSTVSLSDYRAVDGQGNYRSYAPAGGEPYMIRNLDEEAVSFDTMIETDNLGTTSKRAKIQDLRSLFWDREVMVSEDGYLKIAGDKVNAGVADVARKLETPNFIPGMLGGAGVGNSGNDFYADNIYARKGLVTSEMIVHKMRATNGDLIVSDSGIVKSVTERYILWNGIQIHVLAINLELEQNSHIPFVAGDYIECKQFTGSNTKYYRYKVMQVDLSTGSVIVSMPNNGIAQGDVVVRVNSDIAERQGIVAISASQSGAPYVDVLHNEIRRARLGNLAGIPGASGYGLWSDNAYIQGVIKATSGHIGGLVMHDNGTTTYDGFLRSEFKTVRECCRYNAAQDIWELGTHLCITEPWTTGNDLYNCKIKLPSANEYIGTEIVICDLEPKSRSSCWFKVYGNMVFTDTKDANGGLAVKTIAMLGTGYCRFVCMPHPTIGSVWMMVNNNITIKSLS